MIIKKKRSLRTVLALCIAFACVTAQLAPLSVVYADEGTNAGVSDTTQAPSAPGTPEQGTPTEPEQPTPEAPTVEPPTASETPVANDILAQPKESGLTTGTEATAVPATGGPYTIKWDSSDSKYTITDSETSSVTVKYDSTTITGGGENVELTIDASIGSTAPNIEGLTVKTLTASVANLKITGASDIGSVAGSNAVTLASGVSSKLNGFEFTATDNDATILGKVITVTSGKAITSDGTTYTATSGVAKIDVSNGFKITSGKVTLGGTVPTGDIEIGANNSLVYNGVTYTGGKIAFTDSDTVTIKETSVIAGTLTTDLKVTIEENVAGTTYGGIKFNGAQSFTIDTSGNISKGAISNIELTADASINIAALSGDKVTAKTDTNKLTLTNGADAVAKLVAADAIDFTFKENIFNLLKGSVEETLEGNSADTTPKYNLIMGDAGNTTTTPSVTTYKATKATTGRITCTAGNTSTLDVPITAADQITIEKSALVTFKAATALKKSNTHQIADGKEADKTTRTVGNGGIEAYTKYTRVVLEGANSTIDSKYINDGNYIAVLFKNVGAKFAQVDSAVAPITIGEKNHAIILSDVANYSLPNAITLKKSAHLILGGLNSTNKMKIPNTANIILKSGTKENNTYLDLNNTTVTATNNIKTGTHATVELSAVDYTGIFTSQGENDAPSDVPGETVKDGEVLNVIYNDDVKVKSFKIGKNATLNITLNGTSTIPSTSSFTFEEGATLSIKGTGSNTISKQIFINQNNVKLILDGVVLEAEAVATPAIKVDGDVNAEIVTQGKAVKVNGEDGTAGAPVNNRVGAPGTTAGPAISTTAGSTLTFSGDGVIEITGGTGGAGGAGDGVNGTTGNAGGAGFAGCEAINNAGKIIVAMDASKGFSHGNFVVTGGTGGKGGNGAKAPQAVHDSNASTSNACTSPTVTTGGAGGTSGTVGVAINGGDITVKSGVSLLYSGVQVTSQGGGSTVAAILTDNTGGTPTTICSNPHSTAGMNYTSADNKAADVVNFTVTGGTVYARGGTSADKNSGIQVSGTSTVTGGSVYAAPKVNTGFDDEVAATSSNKTSLGAFNANFDSCFTAPTGSVYTRVKLGGLPAATTATANQYKIIEMGLNTGDYNIADDTYVNSQGFAYFYMPKDQHIKKLVVEDMSTHARYLFHGTARSNATSGGRSGNAILLKARWGEEFTSGGKTYNTGVNPSWNPLTNTTISTPTDLASFANAVNHGDKNAIAGTYTLAGNIDVSAFDWTPIGKTDAFKGVFSGGSTVKKITGLRCVDIVGVDTYGLFGNTNGAVIQNIAVDNSTVNSRAYTVTLRSQYDATHKAFSETSPFPNSGDANNYTVADMAWNITGTSKTAGTIVADAVNTKIIGCASESVQIKLGNTDTNVGGIVGKASIAETGTTEITNAKVTNFTAEGQYIGGIASSMTGGKMTGCTVKTATTLGASGTDNTFSGGLAHSIEDVIVLKCSAEAVTLGNKANAGLAYIADSSKVYASYARGLVKGTNSTIYSLFGDIKNGNEIAGVYSQGGANTATAAIKSVGTGNKIIGSYSANNGATSFVATDEDSVKGQFYNCYYEASSGETPAPGDSIKKVATGDLKDITSSKAGEAMNNELTGNENPPDGDNDSDFGSTNDENLGFEIKYGADGSTPANASYVVHALPHAVTIHVVPAGAATVSNSEDTDDTPDFSTTDSKVIWVVNGKKAKLKTPATGYSSTLTWTDDETIGGSLDTDTYTTGAITKDVTFTLTVTPPAAIAVGLGTFEAKKGTDFKLDNFSFVGVGTSPSDSIKSFAIFLEGAGANDGFSGSAAAVNPAFSKTSSKVFVNASNCTKADVQAYIQQHIAFNISSENVKINVVASTNDLTGLAYANGAYSGISVGNLETALNGNTTDYYTSATDTFNRADVKLTGTSSGVTPPQTTYPSGGGSGNTGGVIKDENKEIAYLDMPGSDYDPELKLYVSPLGDNTKQANNFAKAVSGFRFVAMHSVDLLKGTTRIYQTDGTIKVFLPFAGKAGEEYTVFRQNADGSISATSAIYKDGFISFLTNEFCNFYAIAVRGTGVTPMPSTPSKVPQTGTAGLKKLF